MENATKALIIAGSVLVSIIIIGFGMMLINNIQGQMDTSKMDAAEIAAHNKSFESYEGTNTKGTNVKGLIDTVQQHNLANREDTSRWVFFIMDDNAKDDNAVIKNYLEKNDPAAQAKLLKPQIKNGYTYGIETLKDDVGKVRAIKISCERDSALKVTDL